MSFDYAGTAADASELLKEFGQPVTLIRQAAGGAYNPDTGTYDSSAAQTFAGFGVALEYSQREIAGALIQMGDRRVYIGPDLGTTPKTGDTVTLLDGAVLRVMASKPLPPAGIVVLHEIQGRGL